MRDTGANQYGHYSRDVVSTKLLVSQAHLKCHHFGKFYLIKDYQETLKWMLVSYSHAIIYMILQTVDDKYD